LSNYVQTTFFAPKDSLLPGNPAKLIKGADVDPELAAIAAAIATKLDGSSAANPSGTIGLTPVNGAATTYMRSDAAPQLSQAIVPTWTGAHTFSAQPTFNAGALVNAASRNVASLTQTALTFGNGTDNPTYTFSGTGLFGIGGAGVAAQGLLQVFGNIGFQNGSTESQINNWGSGDMSFVSRNAASRIRFFSGAGVIAAQLTSGQILQAVDQAGTLQDVGWRDVPQNVQLAGYTCVLADRGKHIYMNSVGTFTIPANGSVAYPLGTALTFYNGSGGSCSIAITTDTMLLAGTGTTGTRTLVNIGVATALKVTATTWVISGSGLS